MRAVQEGPLPWPPCFGSTQETEVPSSLLNIVRRATRRGRALLHPFLHSLYWRRRAEASADSAALEQKYVSPKGNEIEKPSKSGKCSLCRDATCYLQSWKHFVRVSWPFPTRRPRKTQTHRIRGFSLVLCSLWSLNCSFVETKQRERVSDWT